MSPTSIIASASLWFILSVGVLYLMVKATMDILGSWAHPFFHACRALRPRRSLQQPRPYWLPTVAFQVVHPVGLRFRYSSYEAPSLHLRYGLHVALSTLDLRRYLRRAKTRFAVGWLVPSAAGISPAGCARISRAHVRCTNLLRKRNTKKLTAKRLIC